MSRAKREIIRRRCRCIRRNRRIAAGFSMALLAAIVFITFQNPRVQAEPTGACKYYADVYVKSGDTLWDIAQQYITDECGSMESYIREIKEINNLGVCLQAGQTIVVPYYADKRVADNEQIPSDSLLVGIG